MISDFVTELDSLTAALTECAAGMFTSKNSFLWFVTYHKFCQTGLPPSKFIEFMEAFKAKLHNKIWNGTTFDEMNKVSTKKKGCIVEKLRLLEEFMNRFLKIKKGGDGGTDLLTFVRENVSLNTTQEDIDFYCDILEDLTLEVDNNTKLLEKSNRASLTAIIAYACERDMDLDVWFVRYFKSHMDYVKNQKKNFACMVEDLHGFMQSKV